MTFVTADDDRTRLESLTKLLVSAFPGSTIYQHTDPVRAPHDALNNRVDAVFLEAEMQKTNGVALLKILRSQKPGIPVFILSKTEELRESAVEAGANGYFTHPVSEQQMKDAVLSINGGESAS